MKSLMLILVVLAVFSFGATSDQSDAVKITVTAEKETLFDMFASSSSVRLVKGLKTPYELTVNSTEGRFIFKSQDQKSVLKVKARGVENVLPIVVILIDGERTSTFGID